MTLRNLTLTDSNHFIALEEGLLFKKSVYLVLLVKEYVIGLELNTKLSLEKSATLFSKTIAPDNARERGSADNPYSYLAEKYVRKIEDKYLFDSSIFSVSKNNFRFERLDVTAINYNPKNVSKLSYPNTGELTIKTKGIVANKKLNLSKGIKSKTLIILGKQNSNFFKSYIELMMPEVPESLS